MDLSRARPAIRDATDRVTRLLTSLPDPGIRARRSDWNAHEVAAHLTVVGTSLAQYLGGDPTPVLTPANLHADNARAVAAVDERDIGVLAARIRAVSDQFLELTERMPADAEMPWHGVTATVGSIHGVFLGELLVHGWDVARAAGHRWPIGHNEAASIVEGSAYISRHFVDRERAAGLRATYELRLRRGPTLAFRFDDGRLTVTAGAAPDADCRVFADPRAVMYVIYKRKSQWGQIALGRMVTYGRQPWLALRFAELFSGF